MIEKVRLKTQIIWYFSSILIVVKITRPLRSYQTPIAEDLTCVAVVITMISDLHQGRNLMLRPVKVLGAILFLRSEVKY